MPAHRRPSVNIGLRMAAVVHSSGVQRPGPGSVGDTPRHLGSTQYDEWRAKRRRPGTAALLSGSAESTGKESCGAW